MLNGYAYFITSIQKIYREWYSFFEIDLMPVIIILFFVGFVTLEMIMVRDRQSKITMIKSYLTNIPVFIFNNLILSLLSVSSLLILAESQQYNGLLTTFSQPVQTLLCFVLFDMMLYFWHKANHDYECLWLFHKIHHCDKSMNVSTSFRVHFIEVLLTTLIKALFIIVTGVETAIVAFCEIISTVFIMFHHLNIRVKNEKWLKWLFIVPSLHQIHHSELRKDHDSNYGAVFSLWDRMFRTLIDAREVKVGLVHIRALSFYELLKLSLSFNASTPAMIRFLDPDNYNEMIEKAAYYKAEKRGFAPGFETQDRIEAEKQISDFNYAA